MGMARFAPLALLLAITTAASATPPATVPPDAIGSGRTGPFERRLFGAIEELDLTPAQHAAIKEIANRYRTRGMDLAQRASDMREQFMDVSPDDAAYADATARSAELASALAADAVRLASELRAEIHGVLTPAQRELLEQRARERRQRWDDWRERHRAPK